MLNKEQARAVAPLVNNNKAWQGLEEYLSSLKEMTVQALMVAQSESELRQLQGKMVLGEPRQFLFSACCCHRALLQNSFPQEEQIALSCPASFTTKV